MAAGGRGRASTPSPGERVLDLAAGTGTVSEPFADGRRRRRPVRLLARACSASASAVSPDLPFVAGDALRLPFADASFDAVTISFGLRNVSRHRRGAARAAPGHPARRAAGGVRVQPPDLGAVPHRLRRVPDAGAAAGRPRGSAPTPTPTSTSPSRSGLARPGGAGRGDRPRPAGSRSAGATSPAASSPCTARPARTAGATRPRIGPGRGSWRWRALRFRMGRDFVKVFTSASDPPSPYARIAP